MNIKKCKLSTVTHMNKKVIPFCWSSTTGKYLFYIGDIGNTGGSPTQLHIKLSGLMRHRIFVDRHFLFVKLTPFIRK